MPIREQAQKTNEQHAVPQNIMDVEFKLIGSLTMRQFMYLLVFCVPAYIFFRVVPHPFKFFMVVSFSLFGVAFAFLPLQDRGLDEWIANFLKSVYSPSQRVWKKKAYLPAAFIQQSVAMVNQELITLAPTSSRRKLEEYLQTRDVEQKVDILDIPEIDYVDKVRKAFAAVEPVPAVSVPVAAPAQPQAKSEPVPQPVPSEASKPVETPKVSAQEAPKQPVDMKPQAATVFVKPVPPSQPEPKKQPKLTLPRKRFVDEIPLSPITPDRHAGRRFVNLAPGKGQIVLPIRNEKILKTREEVNVEEDIKDKTEQLVKLLTQLKKEESVATGRHVPAKRKEEVYKQVKELRKEIAQSAEDVPQPVSAPVEHIPETERNPAPAASVEAKTEQVPRKEEHKPEHKAPGMVVTQLPPNKVPNIISGIVKDTKGRPLTDLVLIIKNSDGDPVRALKTNSLGQFSISTPLADGSYTIEIDSTKKTELAFDIISLNVNGKILSPMEFVGR